MWIGSPLLTRSVANNLRKSCGVKQAVRKPGWRSASGVVQDSRRGQVGQGDALRGQGDRDVEQRGAVVDRVHRGALHLLPELVQQRVVLGDEEPLAVVEELVGPECLQ
jgi:hypothetical protein